MDRREFLALAAAAGATGATAQAGPRLQVAAPAPPWYATMRRCGQLNFNERDPLALDVAAWIDYWASLRVDALLVNGGGIMAFYPTEVPYHHRSGVLGSRDLFAETAAAARRRREPPVQSLLRGVHGPPARGVAPVGRGGAGAPSRRGLRGQPGRGHPRGQSPRAHRSRRRLVQRRPPGPLRRYAAVGLRAAGSRGPLRDAGAHDHQRNRRLQQQPAGVAPRREARGRDDAVDGANGRERHGAVVPLAGRLARGPALARHRARVLFLARCSRDALPPQ